MNSSFGAVFTFLEKLGSAALNQAINGSVQTPVTATGTNAGTAYPIISTVTIFGTVAVGTGAILPIFANGQLGFFGVVINDGLNNLTLYPGGGQNLDGGGATLVPPGSQAFIYIKSFGVVISR